MTTTGIIAVLRSPFASLAEVGRLTAPLLKGTIQVNGAGEATVTRSVGCVRSAQRR